MGLKSSLLSPTEVGPIKDRRSPTWSQRRVADEAVGHTITPCHGSVKIYEHGYAGIPGCSISWFSQTLYSGVTAEGNALSELPWPTTWGTNELYYSLDEREKTVSSAIRPSPVLSLHQITCYCQSSSNNNANDHIKHCDPISAMLETRRVEISKSFDALVNFDKGKIDPTTCWA